MNLGACVVSSDVNPMYLDCFPLVWRMWRDLVGVRLVLALVSDRIPDALEGYSDDIILAPPVPGVHSGFQAQCIRLLAPQLIAKSAGAVLTSDIDMLPMNRDYFIRSIEQANDDAFVIYRSDAIPPHEHQIPICYNAALPATWAAIFEPIGSVADANAIITRWYSTVAYDGTSGAAGWTADQRLLLKSVNAFDPHRVVRLKDRDLGFKRLDRADMRRGLSQVQRFLASRHFYADYHMKRPHSQFRDLNERVARLTLSGAPKRRFYDGFLNRFC